MTQEEATEHEHAVGATAQFYGWLSFPLREPGNVRGHKGAYAWQCSVCGHIRVINEYNRSPAKSPRRMACGGCTPADRELGAVFSQFEVIE